MEYAMFMTYDCLMTIQQYGLQNLLRVGFFSYQFYQVEKQKFNLAKKKQIAIPSAKFMDVHIDIETCRKPLFRLPAVSWDRKGITSVTITVGCTEFAPEVQKKKERGQKGDQAAIAKGQQTAQPTVFNQLSVSYPQVLKGFCEIFIGRIILAKNSKMCTLRHVTTYLLPPLYPRNEVIIFIK